MTKCSRCGKEKYPLIAVHNKVSRVTSQLGIREMLKDVDWSCRDCLTPEEKEKIRLRELECQPQRRRNFGRFKNEFFRGEDS